jgi:eukaryotic-like serine/threonine-protein kinase
VIISAASIPPGNICLRILITVGPGRGNQVSEGPYTKIGTMAGIAAVVIAYLSLAYTAKWYPFQASAASSSAGSSVGGRTGSGTSPSSRPSQESLDNVWVAQLASVPITASSGQLQNMLAAVRTEIPGAGYLDSSDFASLRPGYWMIYYSGSFQNGNDALEYCAVHGRTSRNQCVGRFLSHNKSDVTYICFPPAGSQTEGCYH